VLHLIIDSAMSKSVTAITVGYALCDGLIKSIDDKASSYLPELENTSWGDSSIRDLLLMASGSFNRAERSGHLNSNMSDIFLPSIYFGNMNRDFFDAMKSFDRKASPAGSKFVYNNFDTLVLGLLLEKAVGTSFAKYFEKTVWKDVGAEFDGAWLVNNLNQTSTYQGFSARPMDWIRLGLLVFRLLDNQESCISNHLKSLTTHQIKTGNRYMGEYGFQTWIPFEKHIDFAFVGYWGQYLLFNKEHNIVLYHHATSGGAMTKRPNNTMNKIIEIESTGRLK
jgi:CubicO group peptidase (beta-lactamase class C family)